MKDGNAVILVKGCSGSGKSTRLYLFIEWLESIGEVLEPFNFKMADGVIRQIGVLAKNFNLLFIGKFYENGGVRRWQGHDAVTGRFVNSDGLTTFLKEIKKEGYDVLIEGAGTTATWRLRPKFLFEECGYKNILHVLYNYKNEEVDEYMQRINYRSGKAPKSDAMWRKNKTFWSDFNTAVEEASEVNKYGGNVVIHGLSFSAPLWDLGKRIFEYMGNMELYNDFKQYCEKSDYIDKNRFENFQKENKPVKIKTERKMVKTTFTPGENFQYYLYWMCERMNIFWKKLEGQPAPWTDDPILNEFKFCNVYRCLDRVSQYLISHVIYNGKQYEPEDIFYRILLFKHFNRIETWELLEKEFGDITLEIDFEDIARLLDDAVERGEVLYGNAYIIGCFFYSFKEYAHIKHLNKHRIHLRIYNDEIFGNGHIYDFLEAQSLEELFNVFRAMKIYGDFTAQQYAIDMNYSPLFNFDENSFVITGPGSIRGIERTFEGVNKKNYVDVIKWVQANLEELLAGFEKEVGMTFRPLPGRMPTLIDCQSGFCEIDKYLRGSGIKTENKDIKGERIKTTYTPKGNINYYFPPKWKINLV